MASAVVTGATGLLGGNLAAALLDAGHSVRCTRRATSAVGHLDGLVIEWVEADVRDVEALTRAFAGAEVVFHCAAAVSISKSVTPQMQAITVDGTAHVVEAVRRAGVGRLVHCSSTVAVGLSVDGTPCDESAAFNFAEYGLEDGYVITKRAAEDIVRAAAQGDVDAVIVNPGYMFGPFDARPSSGKMIIDVARGKVPGVSTGKNSFVAARAVAEGMIAAWQAGRRGERYILAGENLTYAEMFGRIAAVAGVEAPTRVFPRWMAAVVGRLGDLQARLTGGEPLISGNKVAWGYCDRFVFDSGKARRELGYAPGEVEDGVRAALAWFRETGRL